MRLLNWCVVFNLVCVLTGTSVAASAAEPTMVVTLLGTGAPPPDPNRMGPATMVQAGGRTLLFDAGRGTSISLQRVGIKLGAVTDMFITHMHPDHIVGLPDFWLVGHLPAAYAQRKGRLHVTGPVGTVDMVRGLEKAYKGVIEDWKVPGMTPESSAMVATEFSGPGVVFQEDGLTVTAFRVDHTPKIPCYGYRVEYLDRVVVISGDTSYSEKIVQQAAGADLVVHEVFYADLGHHSAKFLEFLESLHTTPEQVGKVLRKSGARAGVVTHISSNAKAEELLAGIHSEFDGKAWVGYDGMQILIDDEVTVRDGRVTQHEEHAK